MKKTSKATANKDKPSPKKPAPAARATSTDGDWRAEALDRIRSIIKQAVPDVVEEVKWRKPSNAMQGVPVWSSSGIICTGETYKDAVKMTFAKGASLEDPSRLFNASLDGGTRRAIDIHAGDKIDEKALKALVRAAAALNATATPSKPTSAAKPTKKATTKKTRKS